MSRRTLSGRGHGALTGDAGDPLQLLRSLGASFLIYIEPPDLLFFFLHVTYRMYGLLYGCILTRGSNVDDGETARW
jgi:hypothetical protein